MESRSVTSPMSSRTVTTGAGVGIGGSDERNASAGFRVFGLFFAMRGGGCGRIVGIDGRWMRVGGWNVALWRAIQI